MTSSRRVSQDPQSPSSVAPSPHPPSRSSTSDHFQALLRYQAQAQGHAIPQSSPAPADTQPATLSTLSVAPHGGAGSHEHGEVTVMSNVGTGKGSGWFGRRKGSMSIGDDLPHMPEEPRPSAPPATFAWAGDLGDGEREKSHESAYPSRPAWGREKTPLALKGANAMLVDREMQRIKTRRSQAIKRKWRVITGVSMLVVLGLSSYVLARYILAWLSLSPATFFLSDAQTGVQSSPDPLLRTIAMLSICVSAISVAGVLMSGFYLRFSRRRSCGTYIVFFMAILATVLQIAMCIANIALIVLWNRAYSGKGDTSSQLAQTRDVALRCNGVWDMDLLWSAAESSPLAKPTDDNGGAERTCDKDPKRMLSMYLMAGGVRLGLIVLFCTIWLLCLTRYNRKLAIDDSNKLIVPESTEMHRLLEEDEKERINGTPGAWGATPSQPVARFAYDEETLTGPPVVQAQERWDQPKHSQEVYADGQDGAYYYEEEVVGRGAAPPRLQHFAWQRVEEPAGHYHDPHAASVDGRNHGTSRDAGAAQEYGNLAPPASRGGHDKELSAGGWSAGLFAGISHMLWGSSGGNSAGDGADRAVQGDALLAMPEARDIDNEHDDRTLHGHEPGTKLHPEDDAAPHERGRSGLGVSSWFGRDASMDDEGSRSRSVSREPQPHPQAAVVQHSPSRPSEERGRVKHQRTASQERRAQAGRHASSPSIFRSDSRSRAEAQLNEERMARERRERERKERLARLSFGFDKAGEGAPSSQPEAAPSNVSRPNSAPRRLSSSSSGDELPHMPSVNEAHQIQILQPASGSALDDGDEMEDGCDYWMSREEAQYRQHRPTAASHGNSGTSSGGSARGWGSSTDSAPVFVRTLGRLVRKLSAIESVGSAERERERSASNGTRGSTAGSAYGGVGGNAAERGRHSRGPSRLSESNLANVDEREEAGGGGASTSSHGYLDARDEPPRYDQPAYVSADNGLLAVDRRPRETSRGASSGGSSSNGGHDLPGGWTPQWERWGKGMGPTR